MERKGEQGFALIAVVVMVFLMMLALGIAAPRVAKELRRDREVEALHRGEQYTRAIRVFYRKNGGHYPNSIDQLEKTNNVRYLRQRYVDPMTGKDDWRLIHVGENKTTVKGFFGQPLAGLATSNIGSTAGLSTPGNSAASISSSVGGASGNSSAFGNGAGSNSLSGFGGSAGSGFGASSGATNSAGGAGAGAGATGTGTQTSSSGSQPVGAGGPVIGVGTGATGDSILDLNEQTSYESWEFIYDPRIEQLYAKAALMGGAATSSGGLGSSGTNGSTGLGGSNNQQNGPNNNNPFGSSSPNSPSSPGSNSPFGSSPGGFGSTPTR